MGSETDRTHWETRLARWGDRLRAWGMEGLAAALLEAAEPLSPLGAQALYVAQPALGIFLPADDIGQWARLLEDPASVARLRARLFPPDDSRVSPDEDEPPDGPGH
jgi:hypothetical protein